MRDSDRWFEEHQNELIGDLCDLIRIPSVSRKTDIPGMPYGEACREVLNCMLSKGERDGFLTHDYEGYCGSIVFPGRSRDGNRKTLGIFGHLDVVEAGEGWSHDPFLPVVTDGVVSGRGAADDKGSLLSAYYALKYLKSSGYDPNASFFFFLGLNEEKEMEDIDYFLANYREPDFSVVADIFFPVCIGEKGVMNVSVCSGKEHRNILSFHAGASSNAVPGQAELTGVFDADTCGRLRRNGLELAQEEPEEGSQARCVRIRRKGKGAHAAFPEGSENAMVSLAERMLEEDAVEGSDRELLEAVAGLCRGYRGEGLGICHKDPVFGDLTAVGTVFDYDGSRLRISFNIRYGAGMTGEQILEAIRARCGEYGFRIERYDIRKPFYRDPADDASGIVRAINEIACRRLGINKEPYVMSGGTYAKKLQRAVGFGPDYPGRRKRLADGYGGGHQPDEYMDVQDIKKAFSVYAEAFQEMDRRI